MPHHCCTDMTTHLAGEEVAIVYWDKFREYGIRYLDGGTSIQPIHHCPWCGNRLPSSLRDEWFDRIEAMGLEPDDPAIPIELQTNAWWSKSLS